MRLLRVLLYFVVAFSGELLSTPLRASPAVFADKWTGTAGRRQQNEVMGTEHVTIRDVDELSDRMSLQNV